MKEEMQDENHQGLIRVSLLLGEDVVAWIDSVREEMGFRRRDVIVDQLLRELMPRQCEGGDGPTNEG